MKKIIVFKVFLLLLIMILFSAPYTCLAETEARPCATILYYTGGVLIYSAGISKWVNADTDIILLEQDKIKTGKDSCAVLYLWDKSTVKIGQETEIVISDLKKSEKGIKSRFKLILGRIWADVEKFASPGSSFEVEAPYAVASVGGTSFEMESDSQDTVLNVWDGRVNCTYDDKTQEFNESEDLIISKGDKPKFKIGKFNPEKASQWQKWNMEVKSAMQKKNQDLPKYINLKDKNIKLKIQKLKENFKNLPAHKKYQFLKQFKKKYNQLPEPLKKKIMKEIKEQAGKKTQ